MVDRTHTSELGRKKPWASEIWEETNRRHRANTLREPIYPHPTPTGPSKQPTLAELWLQTAESESEADDPPPGAPGPSTQTAQTEAQEDQAKAVVVEHVERVEEESMCRDLLTRVNLVYVPWYENVMDDTNKLKGLVQNYVETFTEESTREFDMSTWPTDARMYVQETVWCFEALAARGWTPYNLRNPRDHHIRTAAGDVHPAFSDPGNLVLDQVVHILRLWRFVSSQRLDPAMRVAPQPYGDPGNMSASGPINLRGNIVEALLHDLSNMASDTAGKGSAGKGFTERGWRDPQRPHSRG